MPPVILIRCDGSSEIGLGHVVRCLALADELRGEHQCTVRFAMRSEGVAFEMVQNAGYEVLKSTEKKIGFDYGQWLRALIGRTKSKILILDVRDDLSKEALERLKKEEKVFVIALDDFSQKRLGADLVFYPPVPQVKSLDWTGFKGKYYAGWEWVILRPEFLVSLRRPANPKPVVLVTMGASDPAGMTLEVVNALDQLEDDFDVNVVLGAAFLQMEALNKILAKAKRRFTILKMVHDMAELMARADFAIASFGVTAYELAAVGVPAIYLCLSKDHAESASVFEGCGIGISLGIFGQVSKEDLADKVKDLLRNKAKLIKMSGQAGAMDIGNGAVNIVKEIFEGCKTQ